MKNHYLKLFFCLLLLAALPCISLFAMDFGLVLDQSAGYGGSGDTTAFDYSGNLIPRFSTMLGESGFLYISGGAAAEYKNEVWTIVPELLRTEISWRFDSGEFIAGRMNYADPLGYIASGLFDGAQISLNAMGGTFSAGAWYTGFLYKRRANIAMTGDDMENNIAKTEYDDFFDTYFASKRVVGALGWKHPGLGERVRVNFALLGQFDLSGGERVHSQYVIGKAAMPVGAFVFSLGGSMELLELEEKDKPGIGVAGELGVAWSLPTGITDQLSLLGIFTSGSLEEDGTMVAFLPLTTKLQGEIFEAKLSAMSVISLDYTARFHRTFSATLSSSYFIRSDLTSAADYGPEGYFLGNEFFGRLLWSPVSDLQLNLGGGVFLPSLGNVAPDADLAWRIELGAIFSLY